ncbi:MAG: phosphoribosyltransferase family protein [Gammaproteobacteria bacterium]|nr:phosphoribosyltransferase family protein [Gammaproteobacteria bacterium]
MRFRDRVDAGKQLALALKKYQNQNGVVYALPRGGVVLGVEVARVLKMPLDLLIPRKIGHPLQPEYAICAVVENGEMVCNQQEVVRVDPQWFQQQVDAERHEARRRREFYLGGRAPVPVEGKTAIIVDDGIATGLTMEAAIRDARRRQPARLVVAVPVAPPDTVERLSREVDEFVVLDASPHYLGAVGAYYDHFLQVSDEDVNALMRSAVTPAQTRKHGRP